MTGRPPKPEAERFWANVDVRGPDECWPWVGSTCKGGYGQFRRDRAHGFKMAKAHAVAKEYVCGYPPPDGQPLTLHSCDNRPCCNAKHLFYGTHQDNVDDMMAKGRNKPMRGPDNPMYGVSGQAHPNSTTSRVKRWRGEQWQRPSAKKR